MTIPIKNRGKLLVLGATNAISEIVRKAHAMGVHVTVADYNEHAPAKEIADEALLVDATDVDTLSAYVLEQGVDGIITGYTDSLLPAYCEICRRTGRPCYLNEETLRLTLDKALFKSESRKLSIPTIREYGMDEKVNFPVLVKPVDNSGARGISVCRNEEEFCVGKRMALEYSSKKKLLIEDYLEYQEATAFYVFMDGKAFLAALADRHVAPVRDGFIRLPTGYTFPSKATAAFERELHPKFLRLFEKFGVKNGVMFIQGFVTPDDHFIPYEPGFRLTASFENFLFEKAGGYDSMAMLINFALTGEMCHADVTPVIDSNINPPAYNISFLIRPGTIAEIKGLDRLLALKEIVHSHQSYKDGFTLPESAWGKLAQVFLRLLICGGESAYAEVVRVAHECLHVYDEHGQEMLINKGIVEG